MKRLFAGCVAVSFAAVLAACGDDSSSISPDASGNDSSSSVENVSSSSELPPDTSCCKVKESSSSVTSSESLPLVSGGVWPKFLWEGSSDEEGRVVTGIDAENAGYWYTFNDNDDGGSSKCTYPPDIEKICVHNWYYTGTCYEFMKEIYGGIAEKVVLGAGAENPYVGLGFNILNEEQEGIDVSEWGGLCLEYSSELKFQVRIIAEDGTTMEGCYFTASIGASESKKVVDIPWSKFGSSCGAGIEIDAAKFLAKAAAVHLLFEGKAGDTGDFLLTKIGSLGQCGSGSAPVSSFSAKSIPGTHKKTPRN